MNLKTNKKLVASVKTKPESDPLGSAIIWLADLDSDPHGGKMLDPDPYYNPCGSETLSVLYLPVALSELLR
jgi:hypothetical protein